MTIHTDVVCSQCGCVCDDLIVEVQNDLIVQTENACPNARAVFHALQTLRPVAWTQQEGEETLEFGIQSAVRLLQNSRAPLIFGMAGSTTETQRAAIRLAEYLEAVIDTNGSALTRASMLAFQQVGMSTCTLGEVRQRADLIVIWGADPVKTHPRLLERYAGDPAPEFLPNGRADRTIVLLHSPNNDTAALADIAIPVEAGTTSAMIAALRTLIRDQTSFNAANQPVPLVALRDLAERMRTCRYGVLFFGPEFVADAAPHQTVESLYRLVSELNAVTRFSVRPLGNPGAENVLAWQTGFPIAVNFQQRGPKYQPDEFSADTLLQNQNVDCCVVIGSQSLNNLPSSAVSTLQSIPTIVIDPPHEHCPFTPTVQFITALPGIQASGTLYRMDEIPLPLKKLCDSPYPTAESILTELFDHLSAQKVTSNLSQN